MAEWLGNGLQNRAQQFDSAWNLHSSDFSKAGAIFLYILSGRAFFCDFHIFVYLCKVKNIPI